MSMADNTARRGSRDRKKIARGQGYEVSYFASKHGLSLKQARELIDRVGNDRAKLNEAAEQMRRR
jgi:hypothetical protein